MFEAVPADGNEAYRVEVFGIRNGATVEAETFEPSPTKRLFSKGSFANVRLTERPMFVEILEQPSEENFRRLVLDFEDGAQAGQTLQYNAEWLNSLGFHNPVFIAEDGHQLTTQLDAGFFVVEADHFSYQVVQNGITLSLDVAPGTVYADEKIPILWHTDFGSSVTHSEIHWGTNPNLLVNSIAGQPFPLEPTPGSYLPVYENSTLAKIPAQSSPTTVYFRAHAIVDLTSLITPTEAVNVVARNLAPTVPSLVAPSDNAAALPSPFAFSWTGGDSNGDDVTYQLFVGTENPPPSATNVSTATTATVHKLGPDTTYYWRVLATDALGLTSWSPTWTFTTAAPPDVAPYGAFEFTRDGPNRTVYFDASPSYDLYGEGLEYGWEFGDGGTAMGLTTSHTYLTDGPFTAVLRVTETDLDPGYQEEDHECIGFEDVCFVTSQRDGNKDGDAPGDEDCTTNRVLAGGSGGTPGSYNQNTLSALVLPPDLPDLHDCYQFRVERNEIGAMKLYYYTDAPDSVFFEICRLDGGCSTTFGSWSGSTGGWVTKSLSQGTYQLHAYLDPLGTTQHYMFKLATNRDFDDWKEEYRGMSYNDYEEFVAGGKFHLPDSDGDTMKDGYERFYGLDFVDSTDGNDDSEPTAGDGILNKKEYYFDACGVYPSVWDVLVEPDWLGGDHTNVSGHDPHTHEPYSFDAIKQAFRTELTEATGLANGNLMISTADDNKCGGTTVTEGHTSTTNNAAWHDLFPTLIRADHVGSWHHLLVAHKHGPSGAASGVGHTPGDHVILFNDAFDQLEAPDLMWQQVLCQEIGHNFGLKHPADNDETPPYSNPEDVTCMYYFWGEGFVNYGTHAEAAAERQDKMDELLGNEWWYVRKYAGDSF